MGETSGACLEREWACSGAGIYLLFLSYNPANCRCRQTLSYTILSLVYLCSLTVFIARDFFLKIIEVQQLIIHGVTEEGQRFRPSDWAERLAGVMSHFRPGGNVGPGNHITYSPYVVPNIIDGVKCVIVDFRLRELEPLAWKFVADFAKDNKLKTSERTR